MSQINAYFKEPSPFFLTPTVSTGLTVYGTDQNVFLYKFLYPYQPPPLPPAKTNACKWNNWHFFPIFLLKHCQCKREIYLICPLGIAIARCLFLGLYILLSYDKTRSTDYEKKSQCLVPENTCIHIPTMEGIGNSEWLESKTLEIPEGRGVGWSLSFPDALWFDRDSHIDLAIILKSFLQKKNGSLNTNIWIALYLK